MKYAKRSLFVSAISLLLCVSMLVGTTFAWFTDGVSSGSNVITSGNLDLDVQYTLDGTNWNDLEGATDLFQKGLWEPGHTEVVALKISNIGSLALKYVANMKIFEETIGKTKTGEDIVLSDILTVSTLAQPADATGVNSVMLAFMGENQVAYETTSSFKSANVLGQDKELLPGDSHYVFIKVDMAETVGNEANHDGVNIPAIDFGINVFATQFTYESDSFGNQYDLGATYDDLADLNISATETKTLAEGEDAVAFNLVYNGMTVARVNVPADALADATQPVTVTFDGIDPAQTITVGDNTKAYAFDITVTNLKENLADDQLVTVVVTAPIALAELKAYHNGERIEDAVYDEVAGTITFKTASFSPYAFQYTEMEAGSLEALRNAVKESNVEIKLTADLEIDLTKGTGAARSDAHVLVSGSSKYYNAVNIVGQNVAIDLNGHKITVFCGDAYNSNSDVGALFFVTEGGSLNIIDRQGGGFIKMRSSIYAVWAPYESPSYVDIYSGAFIADSYAGDPIGTPVDGNGNYDPANGNMKNENSNRALIYAGFGGKINVRGGYFLYNNTPNDTKDRNNGAFNAKDFYEEGVLLTIHDGVMLINKEYRQNPTNTSQTNGSYDNYSVKLAKYCEIIENVSHSITIDGKTYNTWCRVTERKPVSLTVTGYKEAFSKGDSFALGDEFAATLHLSDGSSKDVTDRVTTSGFDASEVGVNTITVTYTNEEGDSVFTTYVVRVITPVKMTVEPKRSLYNVGDVKEADFKVTVYDSTGVATTLSDFDMTISGDINTPGSNVNVTVSNNDLSASCTILMWDMTMLDGKANEHHMWWMIPSLFNVSGWSNHKVNKDYDGFVGQTYIVPDTGEVVSGFSNSASWKGNSNGPKGLEYVRDSSFFDLTITNASRYTTLGINCFVGYDTPVSAFGYYFDNDLSTLKFAGPNYNLSLDAGSASYLGQYACTPNYLTCDLYDFASGSTHTVHWVAIFSDGIQTLGDWTVTLKADNKDDASYEEDPTKPYVNVIILAGQSNAAGSAPITDEIRSQYGNKQFSNVFINYNVSEAVGNTVTTYFTNGNNFDMYKLGIGGFGANYFGPELGLADYLSTNAPDESWYIIKYAPSGSELDRQWFGEAKLADRMIGYVQDKINILAKDYNVKVAGFVWMQGESDAAGLAPGVAERYSSNEQKLVKLVRDEFAAYATRNSTALGTPGSGIVFVNGGIATSGYWPEHATVNNAKKVNCSWWFDPVTGGYTSPGGNIANSLFVDTSTLISKNQAYIANFEIYSSEQDNADQAHYCADSMLKLGTWFGQGLLSMIINCP